MVWLFERDAQAVRVVTRYERSTAEYLLIIHAGDGSEIERFDEPAAFRTRLEALEQQFEAERWQRKGPFFLRDGWRL